MILMMENKDNKPQFNDKSNIKTEEKRGSFRRPFWRGKVGGASGAARPSGATFPLADLALFRPAGLHSLSLFCLLCGGDLVFVVILFVTAGTYCSLFLSLLHPLLPLLEPTASTGVICLSCSITVVAGINITGSAAVVITTAVKTSTTAVVVTMGRFQNLCYYYYC